MNQVSERQRKLIRDRIWQTALFFKNFTVIFFWLAGDPAWKWDWYLIRR